MYTIFRLWRNNTFVCAKTNSAMVVYSANDSMVCGIFCF